MNNYLDLFSGIGGFALGAYWAGLRFNNHYYSEVDNYAILVYQQRVPDAIGLGDITKIDGSKLPQGEWIIAGGFPCQDISVAGKGAGLAGSRSGLWFEYARLIGELRPKYAIMENVGALSFRGLDAVLGSLAEIGYDAEWQDIRASDVGAPHRRERIWIVAYPKRRPRITGEDRGILQKNDGQERKGVIKAVGGRNRIMLKMGQASNSIFSTQPPPPESMRMDDGLPETMDRLKCL
jgi:DNA (cytosine-5)-methyltransferase 1